MGTAAAAEKAASQIDYQRCAYSSLTDWNCNTKGNGMRRAGERGSKVHRGNELLF